MSRKIQCLWARNNREHVSEISLDWSIPRIFPHRSFCALLLHSTHPYDIDSACLFNLPVCDLTDPSESTFFFFFLRQTCHHSYSKPFAFFLLDIRANRKKMSVVEACREVGKLPIWWKGSKQCKSGTWHHNTFITLVNLLISKDCRS